MRSSSGGSPRTRVTTRVGRGGRGQSELVAVTLLVVVVVLGSIVVALTGVQALDDNKGTVAVSQAETSLQQLDSRSSDVTLGFDGDTSQVADLQRGGGNGGYTTEREAWIRVTIEDTETGVVQAEVVNEMMGSVVYRRDDTTLALEGGGVWRSDDGGAVMVSPPEFHFRDGTLTLPVVDISGDPSLSGPVRVTRAGIPERKFPNESANLTNRLRDGKVVVTVHSDYYRAWGQYFEDTSNAWVRYDDATQQVNATFLILPGWASTSTGIVATSGAGELWLAGNGARVDSYDSSQGPYPVTNSSDGLVVASGNVTVKSDTAIEGDVRSGDTVNLENKGTVEGDIYWTRAFNDNGNHIGDNFSINGVDSVGPIDGFVELSIDMVRRENNNDETGGLVSNDQLVMPPGGSAELHAGSYYLENLTLSGEHLTLNTTEGPIYLGIRDWMSLTEGVSSGSNITVVGDGTVRIFVLSQNTTSASGGGLPGPLKPVNLEVGKRSTVYVPGDRSPQLQLYGTEDLKVAIAGGNSAGTNASFTGIIYAPAGLSGPSRIYVKNARVYGQVVTANLTTGQNGEIHYDLALQGIPLPTSPLLDRLEFMHVAVHRVEVQDR